MTTIALCAPKRGGVFAERHIQRLATLGTVIDARYEEHSGEVIDRMRDADILVSTWGMPVINEDLLARMPRLRAIFYAAGTVKGAVTPAMYDRGIVISSAAPMNAVPVAEYTVAVILLSNKRFWQCMRRDGSVRQTIGEVPGNYRRTVGLISASMVGRDVIRLLRGYDLHVLLYDPFVDDAEAEQLGVEKVDLPTLMSRSDIVSLHAPNLPELRHMINGELLALMQDGATFINTARGALVDEEALLAELQSGRIYAVLDVTLPEPPVEGSPFYTLPNVVYTPHIAGSMAQECHRMADFAIDELERFQAGKPLQNEVKQAKLAILA